MAGCGILEKEAYFCRELQDWMASSSSKYGQSHRHCNILNLGINLFLWFDEVNFLSHQKQVLFVSIKTTTLPCQKSADSTTLVCRSDDFLTVVSHMFG